MYLYFIHTHTYIYIYIHLILYYHVCLCWSYASTCFQAPFVRFGAIQISSKPHQQKTDFFEALERLCMFFFVATSVSMDFLGSLNRWWVAYDPPATYHLLREPGNSIDSESSPSPSKLFFVFCVLLVVLKSLF